ncbi:uncharacterized protein FMAN_07318 [Fusarium mangiferae]|uniref:Protein kinase domain-containing protein n=1 Tax=Fusarium mangiferae TaxID=192010 RepID=A0A1L7T6S6_FUSMA|nr:uncharacterized protein FMAN_07318 [Fusarium mangiferae]CVK92422.1 uncharacterized protein FMAN_07318 [Fusarium mangiferae]
MTDRDDKIHRLQRELDAMQKREQLANEQARLAREQENAAREREKEAREQEKASREREENLKRDQRNTSYDEYLLLCHEILFTPLKVQDKSKSSGGGTTDVTGKHYPLTLRPWNGFLDAQRLCHDIITKTTSGFLLPSKIAVCAIAEASHKRPVASEEDLRTFEHLAVEDPVENIIAAFGPRSQDHPNGRDFDCKVISFENQPLSLLEPDETDRDSDRNDGDEIFFEAVQGPPGSKKRMALHRKVVRKRGPDKWAIRTRFSGQQCTAFPGEYKAAHKIPVESFQKAMRTEDLFTRVVLRLSSGKVSNDGETRLQEQIEETVAKALAQTFHYMIRLGCSFGYLTAGKSLVFLHIGDDPKVLYYHVSQPEDDAKSSDGSIDLFHTAVAQLAAFCLQTCRDSGKPDLWKERAFSQLREWPQPYAEMRGGTTEEESPQSTCSASSYPGSTTATQELTVELRRTTRASCKPTLEPSTNDTSDDDITGGPRRRTDGLQPSLRVTHPGSKKRKDVPSGSDETRSSEELEVETRPYCTQECMLGLKRHGHLDEKCPNVALHCRASRNMSHPIDTVRLRELIREELHRPVHRLRSVKPLDRDGKYGETGALFKLSLNHYGYTFVGKGTFAAATKRLRHEAEVYTRLEPLQGHVVPVCLGSIDLDMPYPLAAADVVHMLLMSWAGDALTPGDDFSPELPRFQELLRTCGVIHDDLRQQNLVRNYEQGHIMLIDFNLAIILPAMRHKRVDGLSHKRKKRLRGSATGNAFDEPRSLKQPRRHGHAGRVT